MQTLTYTINIHAPVSKVRDTMLNNETYRQWTTVFNPAGSRYEGNRSQGSKILFLGPSPENPDNIGGMVSFIKENRLHEFVSIEHRGMINNGIEDTTSDEIKARAGSHENYSFSEKDGITTVDIAIDMDESYIEYMNETRPQALQKLKEICE